MIDTDAMKDLTYRILENGDADATGTSLATSMFTIQEMLDALNRVQQAFLLDTGLVVTRATLASGSASRYDLNPTTLAGPDSIRPRRVTWITPAQATGAATDFSDDFTARPGPLGSAYVSDPSNGYVFTPSGLEQPTPGSGSSWYTLLSTFAQGDQVASVTIPTFNTAISNYSVGIVLRASGPPSALNSYYVLGLAASSPQLAIYSSIAGTSRLLATIPSVPIPDASTLTFSISGGVLTGSLNGVPLITVSDSQLTRGTVGFITTGPAIATFSASILPMAPARTRVLTQADTWELDHGMLDWPMATGTPIAWWETTLSQQQIGIAPPPGDVGQIGLLYVALATTLDNSGIPLAVPDDWAPYIIWGAVKELLSSDGPVFDPLRAQYAGRRYDEGVELARLILGGYS